MLPRMRKLIEIFALGIIFQIVTATLDERTQALHEELARLSAQKKEIGDVLASIEHRISLIVQRRGTTHHMAKRTIQNARIAFFTYLSSSRCHVNDEIINFDTTPSNLHASFTTADGLFDPTVSGIYVLSWTIATPKSQPSFTTELVIGGTVVGTLTTDSDKTNDDDSISGVHSATTFVVANIAAGSHTFIRIKTHSVDCRQILSNSDIRSTFAGWLLF